MAALLKYIALQDSSFRSQLRNAHQTGSNSEDRGCSSKAVEESPPQPMSPSKSASVRTLARLEAYRAAYLSLTPSDNFDTVLYTSIDIVSGTTNANGTSGIATFRLKSPPQYCNKFGTVHGGAIATVLDGVAQCSTAVVDARINNGRGRDQGGGGATKGLQITYLRPIGVGETVKIVCEVLKSGAGGAAIRSTMNRELDGKVLAVCFMDKDGCERAKL